MSRLFYYLTYLIFFSVTALHAAGNTDIYFNTGMKAFNKGDYEAAKDLFEKATKEGFNRAELHFNLGVTYYKLGQFKKSQNAFYKTLRDKKTVSLAHYNLGLVAKQLNDKTKAEQWFQRAYSDNNEKTRVLAGKQLKILQNIATDLRWSVFSLTTRYDDNLIDPVLDTGSSEGDVFSELFIASGGPANSEIDNGLQFDISAYLNRHRNLDIYDYDLLHLGLAQPFTTGNWLNSAGIQFEFSTFGGHSYQRSGIFEISTKYKSSKITQYRLRYILRYMESLNTTYDYLQGVQHQLRTEVQWKNISKTKLRYTFEINKLDDLTDGSSFSSFSPERHSLDLLHEQPVVKGLNWKTRLGYRVSSYPDANILADGSSVFRSDSSTQISLSLEKQLNTNWHINIEYQYSNIDSNISDFAYASNLYSVGVLGLF